MAISILVAYGTIEGHTGKIARHVRDVLVDKGLDVTLFDTSERTSKVSFKGVTHVILAASVHERRHPKAFEVFVGADARKINARKSLMLSVSLSASFPEGKEDADDYLEEMLMRTGLHPTETMCVPGAIRLAKYDYYALQVIRHVVLRGRGFDASKEEHVFTDWDALTRRVLEFAGV